LRPATQSYALETPLRSEDADADSASDADGHVDSASDADGDDGPQPEETRADIDHPTGSDDELPPLADIGDTDPVTRTRTTVLTGSDDQAPEVASAPEADDPEVSQTPQTASTALFNPSAADAPTAPTESPAMWTLAAAARRDSDPARPADPVSDIPPAAAPPSPAPDRRVVAIAQTAPLAWLQRVPIIGPYFVTPIVAFIHQIPIVSDILHPLIGYPRRRGLPAGTPLPRDVKVISFDGTGIYTHFMPAVGLAPGQTAPTVLNGPGLSLPGATNLNGALLDPVITDFFGQLSIGALRAAGYNVVTWDPRGEWRSGGVLQLDSPDYEARDVSAIISWLATQPEVKLDDPVSGDPRIGMVGVSYGGGIQLTTAAVDHRIDAIVPTIAWNRLNTSLYKRQAFKSGWGTLLSAALTLTFARSHPRIFPAAIHGILTGTVSQSDQDLLTTRGPGDLVNNITAPTLLIQGTADTLFTLQEADDTARVLIGNGVPTKVVWFCGGHGLCLNNLFDLRDGFVIKQQILQWLNRYVKGDESVSTGPQFQWVDQRGQWFSRDTYPIHNDAPTITASRTGGTLPLIPYLGGSGLPVIPLGFKAINALNLTVSAPPATTHIVGAPELTLTYSGTGSSRHIYAQLVDDATGSVLGNLVTPIPVTLDGQTHIVSLPLEPVSYTLRPGRKLTLQLVATAGPYERVVPALGAVKVSSMQLVLPTITAATASAPAAPSSMAA
jgi:ABC-2 type transport system ATP-binding protein